MHCTLFNSLNIVTKQNKLAIKTAIENGYTHIDALVYEDLIKAREVGSNIALTYKNIGKQKEDN